MRVLFKGYKWVKIDIHTPPFIIRSIGGVYLIRFINKAFDKIIYIGSTKDIGWRLKSHNIINRLKKHPELSKEVELLFLVRSSSQNAQKTEAQLIQTTNPIMNVYGTTKWRGRGNGRIIFNKETTFKLLETYFYGTDFKLPE